MRTERHTRIVEDAFDEITKQIREWQDRSGESSDVEGAVLCAAELAKLNGIREEIQRELVRCER